jgi:hypothetical protein
MKWLLFSDPPTGRIWILTNSKWTHTSIISINIIPILFVQTDFRGAIITLLAKLEKNFQMFCISQSWRLIKALCACDVIHYHAPFWTLIVVRLLVILRVPVRHASTGIVFWYWPQLLTSTSILTYYSYSHQSKVRGNREIYMFDALYIYLQSDISRYLILQYNRICYDILQFSSLFHSWI